MKSKKELEEELIEAYRMRGFVMQYDPPCVAGWDREIKRIKQALKKYE